MASRVTGPAEPLDAVVLAGGRSRRLGQDKASLVLDGGRMVDRAVAAALGSGVRVCVVAGPATLRPEVPVVQEQPPFGGPVAGLAAALGELDRIGGGTPSGGVLVIACDLVDPAAAVPPLVAAWPPAAGIDGVALSDPDGRVQWLAAIYRRAALDDALAGLGEVSGCSMRTLTAAMSLQPVTAADGAATDIDTWEDLDRARSRTEEPR